MDQEGYKCHYATANVIPVLFFTFSFRFLSPSPLLSTIQDELIDLRLPDGLASRDLCDCSCVWDDLWCDPPVW